MKDVRIQVIHRFDNDPTSYMNILTFNVRSLRQLFNACQRTYGHCTTRLNDCDRRTWVFTRREEEGSPSIVRTTVTVLGDDV